MNRLLSGPMVYLPATAQVETDVTALALISPAPDAGWRPRFARMTCAHPPPAVDAAITVCERERRRTALCVAGTLTTAAFDQAAPSALAKGADGSNGVSEGAFAGLIESFP